MKTPEQNELLRRWMDGDLRGEELARFEIELAQNPELQEEADQMTDVVGLLKMSVQADRSALESNVLMRWMDGESGDAERASFEAIMAASPAMTRQAASMRKIGEAIREHVPFEREVPQADLFNAQIRERIAQLQAE